MFARAMVVLLAVVTFPGVAHAVWIASWAASPAPPQAPDPNVRPDRYAPMLQDQTIAQTVRLSVGGASLRIRFSNAYGQAPLTIAAVRVSIVRPGKRIEDGTQVTFAGAKGLVVPAGEPALSDPVKLTTTAFERLRIAIYVRGKPACTCHMVGLEPVEVSPKGDYTNKPFVSVAPPNTAFRAFLAGVDVERDASVPVIVALGDSITDGMGSTLGANRRWPDRLAERLAARRNATSVAVIDAGIAGNQLLSDSAAFGGQNALARLDRDALSIPGVTHLIVLEGINDILLGGDTPPSPEAIVAGYRQIVARAHERGVKVIGATITPCAGGKFTLSPAGEAVRREVNTWVRSSGVFDGIADFDAAVRDPAAPERMRASLRSEDGLHPNDSGHRALAEAVDLSLFR